jgi:5'-3' exonuclease
MQNDRKAQFEDYKGNRSSDSSPHANNEVIKKFLSYLNIVSIFPRQLEADDIVSFLCNELEGSKVIVSVDKDFLQLINKDVILFNPIKKEEYTSDNFTEATGMPDTKTWLDVKCLVGDKSDNVPGIEKFGKVKVQKWLRNEIVLNDQEREIFDRNRKLFSLDAYKGYSDEEDYYRSQLTSKHEPSWKQFLEECENRKLNYILNKKDSWHSAFFLQNKLQSLFS